MLLRAKSHHHARAGGTCNTDKSLNLRDSHGEMTKLVVDIRKPIRAAEEFRIYIFLLLLKLTFMASGRIIGLDFILDCSTLPADVSLGE